MIRYIDSKTILSRHKEPDALFGISYTMNLYRGCQHGCIYCDTRSSCYQLGDLSDIRVKKNALEILSRELFAIRKRKATIGTGSMNDPYMPVEKDLKLVRGALQLVADKGFPVHVITKSSLVERDVDLLSQIATTYAAVSFTVTTASEELASRLEPRASKVSERFKAMEKLAKAGVYTGVTLMPLLPFINDTKENIADILRQAKDAGASYVIPMLGVTLRAGSREHLYSVFEQEFPGMKAAYEQAFGNSYACYSPNYERLAFLFDELADQYGFTSRMKFYAPPENDQLSLF